MRHWMQRAARRARALIDRRDLDDDIDAEMRLHVEMEAEDLVRTRGLPPDEARRRALVAFGGIERYKEAHRDARGVRWIEELAQDARYAVRALRATPAFTAAAVVSLALALGANTALFSVVKTVLLDPLPYTEPERVVTIGEHPWVPAEIVLGLQRSAHGFERVAAYYPERYAITGGPEPRELEGARVTPDLFRMLGARMALGRDFVAADAAPGAPRTAIVSHSLWLQLFSGDSGAIGRTIRVDDEPYEIVGVADASFRLLAPRSDDPGIWIPFTVQPLTPEGELDWVIPLGRLASGSSLRAAQSELDVVASRFELAHPDEEGRWEERLRLATVKSELVRNARPALLVLQLAVGVLLLLACANVANLLLARFSGRQREVAVRAALGASRGRLLRQLLVESVLLALLGGLAGLLMLRFVHDAILAVAPANTPRIGELSGGAPVFLFALATSVATGLLFGVLPAALTARHATYDMLKEGGRTPSRSIRQNRISQLLVTAQVALTVVLLVVAGLLARTFASLTNQAPGFRTAGVVTVRMHVPQSRYTDVPALNEFYRRVLEGVRSIPGVQSVALANNLPISRGNATREYVVAGRGSTGVGLAQYGVVSDDYFHALGIPLVAGRAFESRDRDGAPGVAIIDESMQRAVWPHEDAIGKRFRFDESDERWLTVVGVARDTRGSGLASGPRRGFYIPYLQRPANHTELAVGHDAVLLVSSPYGVDALSRPLRDAIWAVDRVQPVPVVSALDDVIAEGVGPQRFHAMLLGAFASIAIVLVVTGIYGVVAYVVNERAHEFGVRMAMGATARNILGSVLRWGARLAAAGVALGVLAALVVSRYLAGFLFGVAPTDPITLAGAVALISLVTAAACFIPAARAARTDPATALRADGAPPGRDTRRHRRLPHG